MSYYNKEKSGFSSYSCVKYICERFSCESENEVRKFNSYIKTIVNSSRYLTDKVIDGFDTYFFGVIIHRRLDEDRYDIYCSSKWYAYYVIKNFHKIAHDNYEKIYSIIADTWDEIQNKLPLVSVEEQVEMQTNLERNFRISMINCLSEVVSGAVTQSEKFTNDIYISTLMGEVVKAITELKAAKYFTLLSSNKLLDFMNKYEEGHDDIKKHESAFISAFLSHLISCCGEVEYTLKEKVYESAKANKYKGNPVYKYSDEDDTHTFEFPQTTSVSDEFDISKVYQDLRKYNVKKVEEVIILPSIKKQLRERLISSITPENIKRKTLASILMSKESEIEVILRYINEPILNFNKLSVDFKTEYISVIALILNQYTVPFIGEQNINLYHKRNEFYKAIENKIVF